MVKFMTNEERKAYFQAASKVNGVSRIPEMKPDVSAEPRGLNRTAEQVCDKPEIEVKDLPSNPRGLKRKAEQVCDEPVEKKVAKNLENLSSKPRGLKRKAEQVCDEPEIEVEDLSSNPPLYADDIWGGCTRRISYFSE
jgi:hypothetical protein